MSTMGLYSLVAVCAAILAPAISQAHSAGGLDPYGCHSDRRSGEYHCHRGEYKDVVFKSKSDMLTNKENSKSGSVLRSEQGRDDDAPSLLSSVLGTEDPAERTAEESEIIIPKGVAQRLEILKDIHSQSLISDEEYEAKRKEILGDI